MLRDCTASRALMGGFASADPAVRIKFEPNAPVECRWKGSGQPVARKVERLQTGECTQLRGNFTYQLTYPLNLGIY